jgi:hypothetical protein
MGLIGCFIVARPGTDGTVDNCQHNRINCRRAYRWAPSKEGRGISAPVRRPERLGRYADRCRAPLGSDALRQRLLCLSLVHTEESRQPWQCDWSGRGPLSASERVIGYLK